MAQFVQSKSAGSNAVTLNASPTKGNLLVVAVARNSGTSIAVPDGTWTKLTESTASGGSARTFCIFWKIALAAESATITFISSGAMAVAAAEYSGIDTISSKNVDNSQLNASGTAQNAPTLTPLGQGDILLFGAACAKNGSTFSLENFSNNTTGVTEREDVANATSIAIAIWDKFVSSFSGTYDAKSTCSSGAIGAGGLAIFNALSGNRLNNYESVKCVSAGVISLGERIR